MKSISLLFLSSLLIFIFIHQQLFGQLVLEKKDASCGFFTHDGAAWVSKFYSGKPPYTYLWNTGQTTERIEGLEPGLYSVQVSDETGCSAEASILVETGGLMEVSIRVEGDIPRCTATRLGAKVPLSLTLVAQANCGKEPYSYSWGEDRKITVTESGRYTVEVTDANQCWKSKSIQVDILRMICSYDPNEISGSEGYEADRWVSVNDLLPYTIRFGMILKWLLRPPGMWKCSFLSNRIMN
jgi:hypothetical protein